MDRSDSSIVYDIREALLREMGDSAADISVLSRDGFVLLAGIVDTLAEKRSAQEIVLGIRGIKGIENDLAISTDGTILDKEVEHQVISKLRNSRYYDRIAGVSARASKGVVTLKGSVETLLDKKRAIDEAQKSLGVKDVVSNIKISSEGRYDDASLSNKLNSGLLSSRHSMGDVTADINRGVVHMSGYVNTRRDIEIAVEIAEGIEGVVKVINDIRVRN
jgi:osmotically-inducible protein OsmY